MSEADEQRNVQRAAELLAGKQVEASVHIGLDVDGRRLRCPVVRLRIAESRAVLEIDDAHNLEEWVHVGLSHELLAAVVELQRVAAVGADESEKASAVLAGDVVFDEMWDALAKDGFCDERGGAEYQRVRAAWFREGYFNALHSYIIRKANEPPSENSAS